MFIQSVLFFVEKSCFGGSALSTPLSNELFQMLDYLIYKRIKLEDLRELDYVDS